jgi:hypothetical protein
MNELITWVIAHSSDILTAITSVVAAASAISALTPSDSDNKAVEKLKKVADYLALNVFHAKK